MDTGSHGEARSADGHRLETTVNLAAVRTELAEIEALEDELGCRMAHLREALPPEQFQLVWALLGVDGRLGLAEHLLERRALIERLARHIPEYAATIRAEARRFSDGGSAPADLC